MPDLKQQLTELIDAFATAKATGNELLARQSAASLVQFLEGVTVTSTEPAAEDNGNEG